MGTAEQTIRRASEGDRRSLARAITWIEMRLPEATSALDTLAVRRRLGPGRPHVIGLTGPPGAGKSTFADALISDGRARGLRVGVIAVDPSSPFSGGAILGDRVRMENHTGDDDVYVRSLSSRGHLGGLSTATAQVVDLLDAAGFDLILVETVGVGQSELGVMEVADTVAVLLTPESGDAVQAMKAGLLEIADLFVVNKADRPGADRLARELKRSVNMAAGPDDCWVPPVWTAVAIRGESVSDIAEAARNHQAHNQGPGLQAWRARRSMAKRRMVLDLVAESARAAAAATLEELLPALDAGELSVPEAARRCGWN